MTIKDAIFFAKYRLAGPGALRLYAELLTNDRASPEEVREINWRRRKAIVEHAFDRSGFYRSFYSQAGFAPGDLDGPEAFEALPLLRKDHLRQRLEEIVATDVSPRRRRPATTGGSTGVPVKVYHDGAFPVRAINWRMLRRWGLSPADDAVHALRRTRQGLVAAINAACWWPTRRLFYDAASMTPDGARAFLDRMQRLRPPVVQGYVGAVEYLARMAKAEGRDMSFARAVWVTSAPVSATQRRLLGEVFEAPVYDQYGCCEVFNLASECPAHQGLHVEADMRHVEFVDERGRCVPDGEYGDVVITDLTNRVCPLIRYANGDRGRALPSRCSCGSPMPLMDAVKGRVSDAVKLPDGSEVAGDYLTTLFDHQPDAVDAFQVYQRADYSVVLLVVPAPGFARLDEVLDGVARTLRDKTRSAISVRVEKVAKLDSDRGKTRFVVSDVGKSA